MADFVHVEYPAVTGDLPTPELKAEPDEHVDTDKSPQSDIKSLISHPFIRSTMLDKAYGIIIGSALGDTIGLYTEFLPKSACWEIYKEPKFSLIEPVTECYGDTHRCR